MMDAKSRRLTAASRAKISELTARGVPHAEAMQHAEWETFEATPVYGGDQHRNAFFATLHDELVPVLHAAGFAGTKLVWRRTIGEVIQIVDLQDSKWRDSCYVNLGVHLRFLPTASGLAVTGPIDEPLCEFRRRLAPGEARYGWSYGATEVEAHANARELVAVFRDRGLPYLATWSELPGAFAAITPGDLRVRQAELDDMGRLGPFVPFVTEIRFPGHLRPTRAARALAAIYDHIGDRTQAKVFTALAYELAGPLAGRWRFAERATEVQIFRADSGVWRGTTVASPRALQNGSWALRDVELDATGSTWRGQILSHQLGVADVALSIVDARTLELVATKGDATSVMRWTRVE
jgi:hypothetical protein